VQVFHNVCTVDSILTYCVHIVFIQELAMFCCISIAAKGILKLNRFSFLHSTTYCTCLPRLL